MSEWNALAGDNPFLRHEFFSAMHEERLRLKRNRMGCRNLSPCGKGAPSRGAMPLYLKSHSYGEYVFDWAWANAYRRRGYAITPSC